MQATMIVLAVLFGVFLTRMIWNHFSNPWKRIRRYIKNQDFKYMLCEFFPGREIIYSERLWIERMPDEKEFIIYFTKPGGGLMDKVAYGVPPESGLYQQIVNTFAIAQMNTPILPLLY